MSYRTPSSKSPEAITKDGIRKLVLHVCFFFFHVSKPCRVWLGYLVHLADNFAIDVFQLSASITKAQPT